MASDLKDLSFAACDGGLNYNTSKYEIRWLADGKEEEEIS